MNMGLVFMPLTNIFTPPSFFKYSDKSEDALTFLFLLPVFAVIG